MDEQVKKKYNVAFMALLLIMLSVFYTFYTIVIVLCIRQYHDLF